jgi:hypothetical protein
VKDIQLHDDSIQLRLVKFEANFLYCLVRALISGSG